MKRFFSVPGHVGIRHPGCDAVVLRERSLLHVSFPPAGDEA